MLHNYILKLYSYGGSTWFSPRYLHYLLLSFVTTIYALCVIQFWSRILVLKKSIIESCFYCLNFGFVLSCLTIIIVSYITFAFYVLLMILNLMHVYVPLMIVIFFWLILMTLARIQSPVVLFIMSLARLIIIISYYLIEHWT